MCCRRSKKHPDITADNGLGRSRGGFGTKIHLATYAGGLPLNIVLSPGQAHESQFALHLLDSIGVQQSFEPGMTVSVVARQHGVAASRLFLWRKQYQEGSLAAVAGGESVVPASELASAIKEIKELQRLLGKKTMEVELLKEAADIGRQKSR